MRHTLENETLTIYMEGELNSYTSEEAESEIESLLSCNDFKHIVFDLRNLRYISSAGLRIIVRVKQRYDDAILVNTPKPVYEVFDMVGFQNVIKIERL